MNFNHIIFTLLLATCIYLLTGCKKKIDEPSDFNIQVDFTIGNSPLALNTDYTNAQGRKYQFTLARIYMCGFQLKGGSGTADQSFSDVYLSIHPGQSTYALGELLPGTYTGFRMLIGVDSAANHADPTTFPSDSPLNPASDDYQHWSWADGYIFFKLEGLADTTASMAGIANTQFVYHVGLLSFLRARDFNVQITAEDGLPLSVQLRIDLGAVADGLDFPAELRTHTLNNLPLAEKVTNLLAGSVTLKP